MDLEYGHRIPTHEDIAAIAQYVDAMWAILPEGEDDKLLDRAQAVFEVYVEGFRKAENG